MGEGVAFVLAANLLHPWLKAMGVGLSTVELKIELPGDVAKPVHCDPAVSVGISERRFQRTAEPHVPTLDPSKTPTTNLASI